MIDAISQPFSLARAADAGPVYPESRLRVSPSVLDDQRAIRSLILQSGLFGPTDADCVDGMFSEAMARPAPDGYRFLSCWSDAPSHSPLAAQGTATASRMIGFACAGRESLTRGTWDLFWVCVSPEARGRGAGRELAAAAERLAIEDGARLMVIYTSSTAPYAPARGLYKARGFTCRAVVPDYYADGDDLLIYAKRLKAKQDKGV